MKDFSLLRKAALSIFTFFAVLCLLFYGISSVSRVTLAEQQRSLEKTLRRNVIDCYITYGYYPESLDYLLKHYPVVYDSQAFFIDYRPVASNLMPDITVIPRS